MASRALRAAAVVDFQPKPHRWCCLCRPQSRCSSRLLSVAMMADSADSGRELAVLNLRHLVARYDSANLGHLPGSSFRAMRLVASCNSNCGLARLGARRNWRERWTDRSNNYSRGLRHHDKSSRSWRWLRSARILACDVVEEGAAGCLKIVNFPRSLRQSRRLPLAQWLCAPRR